MHVLTLVVSFNYRIPRFHWARVMLEMLQVTVRRRGYQALVLFREQLHDDDLLTSFAEHASRWRHVMSDIAFHYGGGYRNPSTAPPESWDEDIDDLADEDDADFRAAFRLHMTHWELVMHQLLLLHVPSPTPVFHRLHRGPIHHASLFRRRRSVSLRISLARKMTARCVRRSLLSAFNTISLPE